MPLREPLTDAVAAAWREEVRRLVDARPRKHFAGRLHVGRAGGPSVDDTPPDRAGLDAALRTDLLDALLQRWSESATGRASPHAPVLWWVRPGVPERHDDDVAWLAAARAACAQRTLRRTFVVVTRVGWYDPETEVGRRWTRVRVR